MGDLPSGRRRVGSVHGSEGEEPEAESLGLGIRRSGAGSRGPRGDRPRGQAPARFRRRFGRGTGAPGRDRPRPAAAAPAGVAGRNPQRRSRRSDPPFDGSRVSRRRPRIPRTLRSDPRHGRVPRRRGRSAAGARDVRRAAARGDPVRWRHQRRRRRRAAGRPRLPRHRLDRPRRIERDRRDRRDLERRADPGRHARSRPRGRPAPARADAPPLSAVVRVLDARRLDRDAGRRPLRDPADAHRRPRALDSGADPDRGLGEPQAARVGSGTEPRPDAARLRGNPRRDHRSVGPGPPAAALQGVAPRPVRDVRGRGRGGAGHRPVGSQPVELPPARPAGGGDDGRRGRFQRGPHPGLRIRLRSGRRLARGSPSTARRASAAGRRRSGARATPATRRPRRGGPSSSTRRTCATA